MVDYLIRLYESTEESFTTNGIGYLVDPVSCIVMEERNGAYELEMEYPVTGRHYSEITLRRIIFAKPNPYDDPQPFRIYSITKPINGIVTINAAHISYDLSGYPVAPFVVGNIKDAFESFSSKSVSTCPFQFNTDKTTEGTMTVDKPSSIRSLLGGSEGSILDIYGGGEYTFDKFNVKFEQHRGFNNGVSIRYGKNLTSIQQEENCSSVYTGVYPYYFSTNILNMTPEEKESYRQTLRDLGYTDDSQIETIEKFGIFELNPKVINVEGTFNFTRILPLDFSQYFDDTPAANVLKTKAEEYIINNDIGKPKVSIDVSFVQLADSEEYANIAVLEKVKLCDEVNVEFPEMNISAFAKCIETEYDVLTNKYSSISLGDTRSNLAATISGQSQEMANQSANVDNKIHSATNLITGGFGGYVIIRNSIGEPKPDEILIMDTDNVTTARNVIRLNKNGIGFSQSGYQGPYASAWTIDGIFQLGVRGYDATFRVDNQGNCTAKSLTTGSHIYMANSGYIENEHNQWMVLAPNGEDERNVTIGVVYDGSEVREPWRMAPSVDNELDVGGAEHRWRNIYIRGDVIDDTRQFHHGQAILELKEALENNGYTFRDDFGNPDT